MKISESISLLLDCYNSIDFRVGAYKKDDKWYAALLVMRFRKESYEQVKKEHQELIAKYGYVDEQDFKIKLTPMHATTWNSITNSWGTKTIKLDDGFIINLLERDFMELEMPEPRYHNGLSVIDVKWKSYHNSQLKHDPGLCSSLQQYDKKARELDSQDIFDYLAKIFQVSLYNSGELRKYIVIAPVFFEIVDVKFTQDKILVTCKGYPKDEIKFVFDFFRQEGSYKVPTGNAIKLSHSISESQNPMIPFVVPIQIDSINLEEHFILHVYRKNGVTLATESGIVSDYLLSKSKFTNPLFETFKSFVPMNEIRQMLLDPKNKRAEKGTIPYEIVFERAVSWLLSLLGLSSIMLEEYQNRKEEGMAKISIDIISGFNQNKIILAHPTVATDLGSSLDNALNARKEISETFGNEIEIISVVFTPKIIETQQVPKDVILVDRNKLELILSDLEKGDVVKARAMIIPDFNYNYGL